MINDVVYEWFLKVHWEIWEEQFYTIIRDFLCLIEHVTIHKYLRPQGGPGVKKHVNLFVKISLSWAQCKKPHQKILLLDRVINFWKSQFMGNYSTRTIFKAIFWEFWKKDFGTIHLGTIHARDLKFGMYLPCMMFYKSDVAILKILIFGLFMATKRSKIQYGRHFLAFFGP